LIGELIYGCDICQEVCPWNEKFSLPLREPAFRPRAAIAGKDARTLAREILAMTDEDFRTDFKGSPMKRAKLRGLKRNAAVVLGNIGENEEIALSSAMRDTDTDVVPGSVPD
jgi:epoxyqueuosine reductase